jgi:hypothetical protein
MILSAGLFADIPHRFLRRRSGAFPSVSNESEELVVLDETINPASSLSCNRLLAMPKI